MNKKIILLLFIALPVLIACHSKKHKTHSKNNSESFIPHSYIKELDSSLHESSGLLIWKNLFWTFNDSGGKNELYGLDFKTGKILITLQIANARNVDWEDIAQDKRFIYISETGNNGGDRNDLKVYRIRKKEISKEKDQTIFADSIQFRFADQTDFTPAFRHTRYDCEALISFNDSLFVFTKDWKEDITKAYGFPAVPGNYAVMPIDSFNCNGLITGADILPTGDYALIGYKNYHSFIWRFNKEQNNFFGYPEFIDLGMLEDAQTEGICFSRRREIFICCEQTEHYKQQIWKIVKKQDQ